MNKVEKQQFVESLKSNLANAGIVIVTKQSGLSVAEVTELRRQIRSIGATYKVGKNTLVRRAIEGTQFSSMEPLLEGPTALSFADDPVSVSKVLVTFTKDNEKLEILGGVFGEEVLSVDSIKNLATLPSLDELRAKLVGILQQPAQGVASVLQAPATQLARVFGAYGNSGS